MIFVQIIVAVGSRHRVKKKDGDAAKSKTNTKPVCQVKP
jgi:hypothetical protein